MRVRPAHRDYRLDEPRPEEWLLIEWPESRSRAGKILVLHTARQYRLRRTGRCRQAALAHRRKQFSASAHSRDLKQEVGLGYFEGRGWRGFHHHATLCIAAYGFLISERETIPPSGPAAAARLKKPAVSKGYRPRGAANPANEPNSIASLHRRIAVALARSLPRWPCCAAPSRKEVRTRKFVTQ